MCINKNGGLFIPAYEDGYKNIRPIPNHLKFCGIPENINEFITDILPNMKFYVSLRLLTFGNVKEDHINEIINNFVLYILGKDRFGIPRYRRYEVNRFPGMQYHKWFLNHLKYFYFTHKQEMLQESLYNSLEFGSNESTDIGEFVLSFDGEAERGAINANEMSEFFFRDTDWTCYEEFVNIIKSISEHAREGHKFEQNAYALLVHKLGGGDNSEFARKMGLSNVAIYKWMRKMKQLLIAYFNGEGIDPENYEEDIAGLIFEDNIATSIVLI